MGIDPTLLPGMPNIMLEDAMLDFEAATSASKWRAEHPPKD